MIFKEPVGDELPESETYKTEGVFFFLVNQNLVSDLKFIHHKKSD
jgi:hypothetical protein